MIISLNSKQFKVISEAVKNELYRLEVLEDRQEITIHNQENLKLLRQAINKAGFLT